MLKKLHRKLLKMFALVALLLSVNATWGQVNENFNTVSGTGGNSGGWSGSIASNTLGTFGDWTSATSYKGDKCVKLGSSSIKGTITTPAIGLTGTATLTFRAGAWDGNTEQTDLVLTVTGTNTTLSAATVVMTKGSFSSYTVTISNCTAASKVTFAGKNASNSRFFLDDVVISQNSTTPTLSATSTSLTGFTYVVGNGPSDSQTFSISGSNFTTATGNLSVGGATNYEVSLSQNSDYAASISVPYTGSAISNKTIYTRLKSGLSINTYNGETITISGGGVATPYPTVTVSGSVLTNNVAPIASNVTVTGTYMVGQLLSGTFTYTDADNDAQGTSTYKWYRANDINGASAAAITNATAANYTLVNADAGKFIRLGVTPVAATGTSPGVEKFSEWSGSVAAPTLTTTPASLSGFTYSLGTGPSTSQSFSLSGTYLTGAGNIIVSAPSNYQVSLNDIDFTSSVNVPYTSATLSPATVYVRLKSGLSQGSYNGTTISISGGGATKTVALSGTVTQAVAVNDECATAITLTLNDAPKSGTRLNATQSISGTPSCGGTAEDDVWYKFTTSIAGEYKITFAPSGDIDGVIDLRSGVCNNTVNVACEDHTAGGVNEVMVISLPASTTYYVRVYDWWDASLIPSNNNFTIAVSSPKPTLTATQTSIAFGNQAFGTTSPTQNFSLSGILLSNAPGNVNIVSANTSFQVSLNGSSWSNNINVPYSASTLANTTIYVRYIPSDFGNVTASLSITGGEATTSVQLTGTGTIVAPIATDATVTSTSGFTANWNAVPGATGYKLDVATTNDFNLGSTSSSTEGFVGGNAPSGWTFSNLGSPYTSSGNYGAASPSLKFDDDVNKSTVTTTTLSGSATQVSFWIKGQGVSGDSAFLVEGFNGTSWITVQNITAIPSTGTTITYSASTTPALPSNLIQFRFTYTKFIGNVSLDDVAITSTTGPSTYVLPYQDYTVNSTSQIISGLAANTTYYYRVRAINPPSTLTSANSNTIPVTTGKNLVWNTNQWTGGATPRLIDNGTIATAYTTPAAGLNIGNLTVNSGVTVDVPANTTITVGGNLVNNNATGANFIVHDNGALVQTGTGTNTGAVTVLKNANPLYRQDYTMWAAPVENQKLIDFSPATLTNRFYEYKYGTNAQNQNIEGYWSIDPANTFSAAKGYLIRMPNVDGTTGYNAGTATLTFEGKFAGKPNTGNYNITASTAANRFTAVGNPYPSPIGVEEFYLQNSDVLDNGATIFLWRKKNSTTQSSSYAKLTRTMFTANGASTDANGSHTGGQDQEQFFSSGRTFMLAPGQGFIVQTKNGATGTDIKFTNSMRKAAPTTGGQAFLRTAQTPASRMWINIAGPDGGFSQSGIAYLAGATTGIDYGYDGKQLIEQGIVSLYSLAENTALAIQARPEFTTSDVVPMGYNANIAGNFTISIDHTDGLFSTGQNVYLKDKVMGITRNISEKDYTFTTEAGSFEDRFEVVYTTAALGTDNPVLTADNLIVYKNGESVNINAGSTRINAVTVFDIRGRKLYSQQNVNNTETVINGLTVQSQVLIIEVATEKGIVSKKIIF
ncbi:T9SS sorting signal type C domain-containing protein [Flavobacterium psychrotrophum]|uniref:T9SS sorting signal type C domain-containing protein n=1 Tax=Flavobacterium psychrotrophum TaxID=2294119 RepID=UPI0013C4F5E3|nr:T9SS sorting signal type C domain-containing protein [Flavobacterium psychrotrophum]